MTTNETLTKENYFSNHYYLSYSRFSRFLSCEAMAFSDYKSKPSVAQLVGSYVDAYFSDELEEFNTEHPEIFNSRTGDLKTDFKDANRLIERIKSDKMLMHYMSGEKQKIMTGEILSVPFKIKIDSYLKDEAIVDLKVMKDFSDVWSTAYNSRVNFVEAYNYDIELAIFQEIVFQNTGKKLPCYLVCVTKEDPADIGLFEIPQDTKILVAEIEGVGMDYPLSKEKLSPVLACIKVKNAEEGIQKCVEMTEFGGLGHSAVVHTNNDEVVAEFSRRVRTGRLLVNAPSTHGAIGDLYNVNSPSLTLGCGSMGNNSTTDNVSAVNLINVKKVTKKVLT